MTDDVTRSSPGAPLVGRRAELAELDQVIEQALRYETAHSVLIVGSPGIGKSRLVEHWMRGVRERHPQVRMLAARCRDGDGPYAAIRRLLQLRFPTPAPDELESSLRAQVEEVVRDRRLTEFIHFLGSFLGVAIGQDNPFLRTLQEDPARHDQIAHAVLRRFLELDAARAPLLVVLEDLHAADKATVSLWCELADSLGGVPVVLVGTGRPELFICHEPLARAGGDHSQLELGPLTDEDSAALLRRLLGDVEELPRELVERAVAAASGSPLYLERLVQMLTDNGALRVEGGRAQLHRTRIAELELPMSVEDAVAARIALLGPAERDVLEKASVIGSVFWRGALVSLTRYQQEVAQGVQLWMADVLEATISEILDDLVARDYLLRFGDASLPGEVEYAFKHNMEREQIQRRLSPERARHYHRFAAQWYETRIRERTEDQLDYLGQHYERGGHNHRAAYCYLHAGDQARARFANTQAIAYYGRGLDLLGLDNAVAEIDGLESLASVCELLGRNAEAAEHFQRMLHVAWLLDHKAKGALAQRRLGRLARERGDYEPALAHFKQAAKLFEASAERAGIADTLDELGQLAWTRGAHQQALEHLEAALRLKTELGDVRGLATTLNNLGRVYQDSGAVTEAERQFAEALERRRSVGDRLGVVDSLIQIGGLHRAQSEYGRALESWTNALHLAREVGDRLSETDLMIKISEALIQIGRLPEAERQLSDAARVSAELGNRRLEGECQRLIAEVYLALGQLDRAAPAAELALARAEELALAPQRGAALLVLAQVAAAEAADDDRRQLARERFDQAIAIFSALGRRLELVRAWCALGDFHERCGRPREADECRRRADELLAARDAEPIASR